jgi:hypothetical protein
MGLQEVPDAIRREFPAQHIQGFRTREEIGDAS